jgi:hypothetical protein
MQLAILDEESKTSMNTYFIGSAMKNSKKNKKMSMHLKRQKFSQNEQLANVLTEIDHGFDSDGKIIMYTFWRK